MMDMAKLGAALAPVLSELVDKATQPILECNAKLEARVAELEARQMPVAIKGDKGEVDMEEIKAQVSEFLQAIPVPQDGKSVTVEDVEPILKRMADSWALDFERRAQGVLERAAEKIPKPKDGRDGLGWDDFFVEFDGERRLSLVYEKGEDQKVFMVKLPLVIDRKFYKEGQSYEEGDGVTFGGSYWIAQADTKSRPEIGNPDWRLAVKKGRDAKQPARIDT